MYTVVIKLGPYWKMGYDFQGPIYSNKVISQFILNSTTHVVQDPMYSKWGFGRNLTAYIF